MKDKNNIVKKLEALEQIKLKGNPSVIAELISSLKNNNLKVRNKTFNVINYFYTKISSGNTLYLCLKYCQIEKQDLDFYKKNFSPAENLVLFSVATYNHNGYVREKAIEELGLLQHTELAIEPLFHRLSDWVDVNRQKALNIIRSLKYKGYINYFVNNIQIISNLKNVQRINLFDIYNELINFIVEENRNEVLVNFSIYSDKNRILLAKNIISSSQINLNDLQIFVNDKNFLVRSLVLERFDLLTEVEINRLLADKSSKIRLETLYSLEKTKDISDICFKLLADSSSSIRSFSRFILKDNDLDFKKLYYKNLINKIDLEGSLYGLKETEGKKYFNDVIPFLDSKKLRIKKAAFNFLQEFEPKTAYKFAVRNMNSEFVGIRKVSMEYLWNYPNDEVLEKTRTLFQLKDIQIKKTMLKFFSKIGKYKGLSEILIGSVDENKEIRDVSFAYLKEWISKSNKYFIAPSQDEIELIKKSLEKVRTKFKEKKYFDMRLLEEIEFHIK
ncbi:hypothetical protein [Chryseobacterium chendengshani]|uniref:hypothetical protein n=1 Tax=Chryseobacterium sp. LJ756 TaxID=2864113 RepID=UPI001C63D9A2|nr:hypothetical protein [Chryseobacterium sp. LJ756]MBW7675054.1 hypothetical protein [Chryseobacterium sp. LJ756]